ncbi:cyclic nucleotide-binding domain-containing protein [Corallococcus coralloides DSM 2259]|uniref:Cyclic nucleotide-binding domain-containing protein n=1 Tax=Corallococcus coralloides (strain ATCC 25202 / DSM 2259 / NBRC 100086 / M2) TaxID=1144275 RepID=H8MXC8_CORCM|nr:cyclic nucleotide-binding domain-containing protein [Corallococcus coralloides]AFE05653.1 cyclic nucleotide-binding domain-containing protein [Corallococcus coralloides DSM 2259]
MESRALKDKATEAFGKGRFAKAAELYEDYCQAEPKDHQSRLRMGDAWSKAGQRDRAVSAYQSAAEGFAKEGFLPRAIAASKLILELDPSHQGVQQMLADLYARRGTPATSRPKPKDAAPTSTSASLISQREAPPEATSPKAAPPKPLEAGGAPVDLSDALPPELALSNAPAPVADDTEVVLSVEVELEPTQDEPKAPAVSQPAAPATASPPAPPAAGSAPPETPAVPVAATPPAAPAPTSQSVRVAPPSPSPMPEHPQIRTPSGRWQALAPPITGPDTAPAHTEPKPPIQAAPPGLRPRRVDTPSRPTATVAVGASVVPTSAGAPEPWRASLRVSSFTELEIEADSLLHAVELAAQRGLAEHAPEEEPVYELTEEAGPGSWDALPSIPLFSDLPRDAFIQLFERCPLRRFGPGERILAQGTHGDAFYVICEGSVRVFREEDSHRQDLATLEVGAFFGEMALLSGAPRAASVESVSDDTQVLEISAAVLATLSRSHPPVAKALKKFCRERLLANVMNSSALFRPFNRKDRRNLVERFRARDVERGDVIIREGDATDGLYVVLSGEVEVHKSGQRLTSLKEGDLFGEISLLQKTPATATVEATRHTTLLRLPREDFDSLISSHPQVLMLVSDLSDERLRRTQHVLDSQAGTAMDDEEEDLILV